MRVLPWLCLAVTACAEPPPAAPTALAVPMPAVGIRVAAGDDALANDEPALDGAPSPS